MAINNDEISFPRLLEYDQRPIDLSDNALRRLLTVDDLAQSISLRLSLQTCLNRTNRERRGRKKEKGKE